MKKINIFGKQISAIILGLTLIATLASAGLLTYFGMITGTADVSQSVLVDGKDISEMPITGAWDGDTTAGDTIIEKHDLSNNLEIPATIDFNTTCKNSIYTDSSSPSTNEYIDWEDGCDGITTRYVEYFDDAGADLSSYEAPATADCDVIVNSSGDTPSTITAGINEVTEEGQTVCVEAGTYEETILINKNVNLAGAGADKTTIDASSVTVETAGHPCAVGITASDVTFQGFTVKNAGVGVSGSPDADGNGNVDARGIMVKETSGNSLTGVKLLNNKVKNSEAGGIQVKYAEVEVKDNEVINNQWDGFVSFNLESSTISDNIFSNNGPSGQTGWNDAGIEIGLVSDATVAISSNTIKSNVGSDQSNGVGIYLRNNIDAGEAVTVENNDIRANGDYGILSKANPSNIAINYNNIVANGEYGVNNIVETGITATNNWWGTDGISVSENVNAGWMTKTDMTLTAGETDGFGIVNEFDIALVPDSYTITTKVIPAQ